MTSWSHCKGLSLRLQSTLFTRYSQRMPTNRRPKPLSPVYPPLPLTRHSFHALDRLMPPGTHLALVRSHMHPTPHKQRRKVAPLLWNCSLAQKRIVAIAVADSVKSYFIFSSIGRSRKGREDRTRYSCIEGGMDLFLTEGLSVSQSCSGL